MEARPHRFTVMLSDTEMRAIDEYRFATRSRTLANAVRQLVSIGLGGVGRPDSDAAKTGDMAATPRGPGRGN